MNQKDYVIVFRSLFSLFIGFMSFAYIAVMKESGLTGFQISLIYNLYFTSQVIFFLILIITQIRGSLLVSSISEVIILIFFLISHNIVSFILISILMAFSSSIFSSVIIIQKDFVRKDYSVLLTLIKISSLLGLGLFYLSSLFSLELILIALIFILLFNVYVSTKLSYKETSIESSFRSFLKDNKYLLPLNFLITARRVLFSSLFPLILIIFYSNLPIKDINLYLTIFNIPLIVFLYIGHKISNKLFLGLSIIEFITIVVMSFVYYISILILLTLFVLIEITAHLRSPATEEIIVKKLKFSTKYSSFFNLSQLVFSVVWTAIFSILIKFELYTWILIISGTSALITNLMLYGFIIKEENK